MVGRMITSLILTSEGFSIDNASARQDSGGLLANFVYSYYPNKNINRLVVFNICMPICI
jgi:hypothetical protein